MEINCRFVRWASVALALSLATGCKDGPTGPQSGALRVAVVSTGVEIDPDGYTFSVDGGTVQPIAANGSVVIGGLAVGEHTVGLAGLAANCTASGANSQSVRVTGTDTVTAFFQVACTSTRGTLQITTTTTGVDLDVNGYGVAIQNGPTVSVGPNQSISVPGIPAGTYTATILGVAPNCALNGPATRSPFYHTAPYPGHLQRPGQPPDHHDYDGVDLDVNGYQHPEWAYRIGWSESIDLGPGPTRHLLGYDFGCGGQLCLEWSRECHCWLPTAAIPFCR